MQTSDITYITPLIQKLKEGSLRVCSVGAGYVGALTSVVLAAQQPNLTVQVVDVNKDLIARWNDQRYPFFEPSLGDQYVKAVKENKNLSFYDDPAPIIADSDVLFICVNTPPKKDSTGVFGKEADMTYFNMACTTIAKQGDPKRHRILIEKSTVPVLTHKHIHKILSEHCEKPDECFTIVSMPEFLAEGTAIQNLLFPDRVVIGTTTDKNGYDAFELIKGLYTNFETKFVHVNTTSSEMGKLFANAMLAQRISSINSMSQLCEEVGGSTQDLAQVVGTDKRIGPSFLCAGPGFGGSCFDKDILSLVYILESRGHMEQAEYWSQVLKINDHQKARLAKKVAEKFKDPANTEIAILGFAFKKNTSDTRATPVAYMINYLSDSGFTIKIQDPQVNERGFHMEMEMQGFNIAEKTNIQFVGDDYLKAVTNSSAILVCTEWDEYHTCNYRQFREVMKQDGEVQFYDFRAYLNRENIKAAGFNNVFTLGQ